MAQFVKAVFGYANDGHTISLRLFEQGKRGAEPVRTEFVRIEGDDLKPLVEAAMRQAKHAAQHPTPLVLASPIAGFNNPHEPWRARAQDLGEGYALSVDCDQYPDEARQKLNALLGPPTVAVASGGQWLNPVTGKLEDKLHLHWRLTEP